MKFFLWKLAAADGNLVRSKSLKVLIVFSLRSITHNTFLSSPDDPKDGLWIWGLFKEPLYPFMLLQMETKELELSSGEGEEKDSIPPLKLYAQINHIRDSDTGNVQLKNADINIRLLEQVQLPGATVDLYENEKVGQISFQPL